jgi:hypothetical protein
MLRSERYLIVGEPEALYIGAAIRDDVDIC